MARGKAKGSVKTANDKEKDKDKKGDLCAIDPKKCLRPDDKRVDWVYCEGCSSWFHCPCVKLMVNVHLKQILSFIVKFARRKKLR